MKNNTIIVVGGGASGMMAAIHAAKNGANVILIEKNNGLGKKLLITGKGRCNVTNDKDVDELIKAFPGNGKFLHTAFHRFSNEDVKFFFENLGVPLKVERGDRVFPVSDRSHDILQAFLKSLKQHGVKIMTNTTVKEILIDEHKVSGVLLNNETKLLAQRVIVATGGMSYQATGSTGDGYQWAKSIGHQIISIRPALIPLESKDEDLKKLQGLSLKNVRFSIKTLEGKEITNDFGEMIFTHFGVSGPIVLTVSRQAVDYWDHNNKELIGVIDFKPALSEEQLHLRLLREIEQNNKKQLKNSLDGLMPQKLIPVFLKKTEISFDKPMHQITKEERQKIISVLKNFSFSLNKARPIEEAIITAGGVHCKEISPKTMESKLVKGLYFVGEILDIDGITGGYNLQAAFSTAYLAGDDAGEF